MTDSAVLPGHLIRRLHQHATQVFLKRVHEAGHDLTPVQFAALDALRHAPGVDQAGLAAAIAKDRATVGSVVDRLAQKGLVARKVSDRDRRARSLTLTERGTRTLDALLPVVKAIQPEMLPGLTPEEYRQYVDLATRAAAAARSEG